MKFKLSTAATLFGFLLLLPLAHAQVSQSIQGNVPFNFRVGDSVLPAGQYIVRPLRSGSMVLQIHSSEPKGKGIMCLSNQVQANSRQNAKLVFHRYGDTYFLSQVWPGDGLSTGSGFVPSRAERAMVREMAAAGRHHNTELASVAFTVR
jgi:hypothetical protein